MRVGGSLSFVRYASAANDEGLLGHSALCPYLFACSLVPGSAVPWFCSFVRLFSVPQRNIIMLQQAQPTNPPSNRWALDHLPVLARLIWLASLLLLGGLAFLPVLNIGGMPAAPLISMAHWIFGMGALVLVCELLLAAQRLFQQTQASTVAAHHYLRIRTPNPHTSAGTRSEQKPDGADFWYAAHRLFPERQSAAGPWLATTLSARPDEPIEFGAVIGGGSADLHQQWQAALRQLIIGHCSEASVDSPPDPLANAIQQALGTAGTTLAWAEFLLPHHPSFPLRIPESATADLLGPLLAQLRPRAGMVRYSEAQIVSQPRHDWRSDGFGWRSAAHRRLLQLRNKTQIGSLNSDVQALERKLNDPASNVVLRIVLVADQRAAAQQMLGEIGSVLGQYAQRSGQYNQRFVCASQGFVDLSDVPSAAPQRLPWRAWVGAILIGCVLARIAWQWPIGLVPLLPLPTWLFPLLRTLFALLWLFAPVLVAMAQLRGSTQARQIHWRNRLVARAPRIAPPLPLLLPMPAWWSPVILSAGELGGIWHLPSPNLGGLVRWLPARHLPAPPHAFIDNPTISVPTGQSSRRLRIGHALRSDGRFAAIGPSLYDLRTIGHLTAGMGAGKSRFFANLCNQLMDEGFTLIDGKGDDAGNLTATVRQYIPREDEWRVVLLDITDTDWPIGVNPLAGIAIETPGAVDRVTAQIQSIFARIDPEGWSAAPGMQQFLDMSTRLVVETVPQPTIAHVKQALIDEAYRKKLLAQSTKSEVNTFWQIIYPSSSDQQKTSMNALMRRFDKLLLADVVRTLITQGQPTFRFHDAIAKQLIVLCPIPHVTYGPLAATAAMLLFQSFLRDAFERPGSATTRRDYPLIVDEFQVLVEHGATQDVAVAITQLRSLGIPTLYAHQAMAQVGDLRDLMLINAENRILMRTQEPDASMYASHYAAAGLSGADIASQEPSEHQYARFVVGGQVVGPISMVPLAWPSALNIALEPYHGPDWQAIQPSSYPAVGTRPLEEDVSAYDQQLLALIYATPYRDELAQRLAKRLSDEEWQLMQSRWAAIARAQRQYILDHPGCIPERNERVRWLSRLGYARPRLLAEAEFLRIRCA
jgi:hypothetical protein